MHPPEPPEPQSLRALIVDDEDGARANLRHALAAQPGWRLVGECANARQARSVLAATAVDVLLLDIQMPGDSGLELARELCRQPEPPLVLFVTAYDRHAIEAFDVHALDYLLKPCSERRLGQALARAAQLLALRQRGPYARAVQACLDAGDAGQPRYLRQLTVRSVGQLECIALDEVWWIGSADNYVELHTAGRTILHRMALGRLAERLDPQVYARVHRCTVVRIDQLQSLAVVGDGSYLLTLRCGDQVAVSERYVQQLRAHCG